MAIFRNKIKERYTVVSNSILMDSNLKLKDMGLLIKLLSLPDNWDFSEAGLVKIIKGDGRDSIRSSLKTLEKLGYLRRYRERDELGKLLNTVWEIFEEPQTIENTSFSPKSDFPTLDDPTLEEQPQYNTKRTNTKRTNTKNISKKERKEKEVEKAEAKKDVKVNKGEVYPNEELQNVENIEELQIVEAKEDKKKTMTLKDKNHSQSENNIKIETIKNCNSNYTTSKSKNQETHEEIIRKFTKDEELIDLLKEYLVMRYVQNNKKALTNRQLKLLLTKLLKLSEKEDEQKEIVSNALMGGYKRFFGLDDKEQGKPAKNMPERHKTANGSEIKPYDLTQRQLEYAKELYEKQERDQGKKVSNSDLFYNWLEN